MFFTKKVFTYFENANRCVNCKKLLTKDQEYYSEGRCPLCGYKGRYSGAIVDTYDVCIKVTEQRTYFLGVPIRSIILSREEVDPPK